MDISLTYFHQVIGRIRQGRCSGIHRPYWHKYQRRKSTDLERTHQYLKF